MTWEGYYVLAVVFCVIVALVREWLSVDATLMAGVAAVVVPGVIELESAIRGFANPTLVALGSLYIVAAALRETGILAVAADYLLGQVTSVRMAIARICLTVTPSSAFMNNTPIVAMGIPAIRSWCRDNDIPAAKLLIPLSYASIFGGVCTLIGTSTNLVTDGLLRSEGYEGFGFFELGYLGVPGALVGWTFLVVASPLLLEEREPAVDDERLDEAEDRQQPDPSPPGRPMREDDRETHQIVVDESSRLIGERVGEAEFRDRYNAAVLYVLRDGEELEAPVDEIVLKPGDTLVLDTGPGFRSTFEDRDDFHITTQEGGARETASPGEMADFDRFGVAMSLGTLVTVIGLAVSGLAHISIAAMLGAALLIGTGVIRPSEAREAIDWQVLIVIGSAIGLGEAMEKSGAAEWAGEQIIAAGATFGDIGLLVAVVAGSSILSQVITNYGAVALFFPIATSIAESQGMPARPLVMGMSIAAAYSFTIPIYQTNLMVYSAGNYRLKDFVRIGIPLQVVLWITLTVVIAFGWGIGT
ncbi:MAG: SLC13 family permease [Bradymonadaceae bacterium]